MTCRGVVRGNTILLADQVYLPEGAAVEVRVLDPDEVDEGTSQHNGAGASARETASEAEDPLRSRSPPPV